jgi:hypothetical protein
MYCGARLHRLAVIWLLVALLARQWGKKKRAAASALRNPVHTGRPWKKKQAAA